MVFRPPPGRALIAAISNACQRAVLRLALTLRRSSTTMATFWTQHYPAEGAGEDGIRSRGLSAFAFRDAAHFGDRGRARSLVRFSLRHLDRRSLIRGFSLSRGGLRPAPRSSAARARFPTQGARRLARFCAAGIFLGAILPAALLTDSAPAETRPPCELCNAILGAGAVQLDNPQLSICARCWNGPRCMLCFLPLSGHLAGDGAHCAQCIERAPRCSACGMPIFDFFRRIAGEPGEYCSHCATEGMTCAVCGVPTRTPALRDGKWICTPCDRVLV